MIPGLLDNYLMRTWSSQPIESHITKEKLEKILREWERHALPGEKRWKAVKEIFKFYNKETHIATCEGKGDLNFYNYKLRSLPDIFSYLPFRHLTGIDITGCFLRQLPDSFSQLQELIFLNFERNELEKVPTTICSLRMLAELNLGENRLKQLPHNMDLLYLKNLNLEENAFEEFPEIISQLRSLVALDISSNNLATLPEHFNWPKNLSIVSLGENKLSSLPEELYELKKLSNLYLFRNGFTHISSLLSRFSKNVHIDISRNQFSEEEVQRVIEITNSPNYNGPVIEGLLH